MHVEEMNHEHFKDFFLKLDLDCLKDMQRTLTAVTNIKMYGREKSMESWREKKETIMNFYDRLSEISSLGSCEVQAAPTPTCGVKDCNWPGCQPVTIYGKKRQEKESAMGYNQAVSGFAANINIPAAKTEADGQRDYLFDRLSTISWKKRDDERKPFGLVDDEAPKTIKERKERMAAGKYIIDFRYDEEDFDEDDDIGSYGNRGTIRWRDPAVKEDKKGYEAAMELFEKDLTATRDIIKIKSPDDGLAAVQAIETRTYH